MNAGIQTSILDLSLKWLHFAKAKLPQAFAVHFSTAKLTGLYIGQYYDAHFTDGENKAQSRESDLAMVACWTSSKELWSSASHFIAF